MIRKLTEEQINQACIMYKEVKSITIVGKAFNVSYASVSTYLRQRGIMPSALNKIDFKI